jgi:hypothetical protein
MRLLSWNMGHIERNWRTISSDSDVDVALLQEAVPPPEGQSPRRSRVQRNGGQRQAEIGDSAPQLLDSPIA